MCRKLKKGWEPLIYSFKYYYWNYIWDVSQLKFNQLTTSCVIPSCTVLLVWIAGLQSNLVDCDWQSKVKIGFWIWIVNPVYSFQSKSKKSEIKSIMLQKQSHATFPQNFQTINLAPKLKDDQGCLFGITRFYHKTWSFNVYCT